MGNWDIDPYYEWLGIQPSEQPADFYRLLGITRFEDSVTVIERAADRQMGYIRQFQARYPVEVSQLLSQLAIARISLVNAEKKHLYDRSLRQGLSQEQIELPRVAREAPGRVWYVQSSGIAHGPFTVDELQVRIKAKEVRRDSLVRKGRAGKWKLARQVPGLFDLPVHSPPAPGTGMPQVAELEPVTKTPDLLSGPLPEPEDRSPGPGVWVCPDCRWPVPKSKTYCSRCGYVKRVSESRGTEQETMLMLLFVAAAIVVVMLVIAING